MSDLSLAPPSGTRDFFAEDIRRREAAIATIRRVFEAFGYEPLETPAFERIELLLGKYGEDEKLVFKIAKRGAKAGAGEADLALRYDFTVPLARVVAHHRGRVGRVFKRYQIGPVWRADRPARGRFREFFQCDVDVVGAEPPLADADAILAVGEALGGLGLGGFAIHLNSRKVLHALLEAYGVPAELERQAIGTIDKLRKVGIGGVAEELERRGVPAASVERLRADHERGEVLDRLGETDLGREGRDEVRAVEELVAANLRAGSVVFDPFIARGLDYYTGPVFEVFHDGDDDATGLSLASGGRYDGLVGAFLGERIPACGGSLGLERILLLLGDGAGAEPLGAEVLVTVWDEGARAGALGIASELRAAGVSAEPYLERSGLGAQLKHAARRGVRVCVIEGPDERAAGNVALKRLDTGEQATVARAELVAAVRERLAQAAASVAAPGAR